MTGSNGDGRHLHSVPGAVPAQGQPPIVYVKEAPRTIIGFLLKLLRPENEFAGFDLGRAQQAIVLAGTEDAIGICLALQTKTRAGLDSLVADVKAAGFEIEETPGPVWTCGLPGVVVTFSTIEPEPVKPDDA